MTTLSRLKDYLRITIRPDKLSSSFIGDFMKRLFDFQVPLPNFFNELLKAVEDILKR